MTKRRLAEFILSDIETILQAWEDFARSIEPPALTMDDAELRDHARQMLLAFASDLSTAQSEQESAAKSKGMGERSKKDTAAETHAEARLRSGFTVVQLVSEYRALRSSVLSLWSVQKGVPESTDIADMTRFNEAVDQALAESVARYELLVKQSRNMFLAILGHDLRNPLGTLLTGSNFIMEAGEVPPKYVLVATRMFGSAKRMSKLINDLIDFTRSHLGPGIPMNATKGDLTAVCEQVVNESRTVHPDRTITFNSPATVDATFDGSRIAQLLSNLLGNAFQYGSDEFPVTINIASDADEISIAVNNQGPVIPPEKIASIFDPMVRLPADGATSRPERTSLGLGLFISREIAHAHGGKIDVSSNGQDGTTFVVRLPHR